MSTSDAQSAPRAKRRWFRFSLRALLLATALVALVCSLFAWQVKRAERQRRLVQAIEERGGHVSYGIDEDGPLVPAFLFEWLGADFFYGVEDVYLYVVLPADWDWDRDQGLFEQGCLVPGATTPSKWERWGSQGTRPLVYPTAKMRLTADDWARAAIRQCKFGCDRVAILRDYCRRALELDPSNIQAHLLLAEMDYDASDEGPQSHLEAVLQTADPESLEYAQAQKLLRGERWTFAELCERVGPDGVLR